MRKKVLSVFMCAAMAMTMLAGCGGNGSSAGNGDTGAVGEDGLTLKNFIYLFENTDFPIWFKNTLIISVATTVSTVFVCALSAYIFSRFRFTFKKTMMMSLLVL